MLYEVITPSTTTIVPLINASETNSLVFMVSASCRFTVDKAKGLLEPARMCASPNCDERPDGAEPSMIVVHGISLPPGQFGGPEIEALFTNTLDWDAHPYFGEIVITSYSIHYTKLYDRRTAPAAD